MMWRQLDRRAGLPQMTGWMTQPQLPGASLRRARSLPGRAARAGPLAAGLRALPLWLISKPPDSATSSRHAQRFSKILPQQANVAVKLVQEKICPPQLYQLSMLTSALPCQAKGGL